jgi:LysM repeat protein
MGRHSVPVVVHSARRRSLITAGLSLGAVATGTALTPVAEAAVTPTQAAWDLIAHCESGNKNVKNANSSASGFFQIINGTWLGNGGGKYGPTAMSATYAQQLEIANNIYRAAGGFSPWNASKGCWGGGIAAAMANAASVSPAQAPAPAPAYQAPASVIVDAPAAPMASQTYTVVRGDWLIRIAHRFGISVSDLYTANRSVIGGNPNLIYPGQVLTINGSVAAGNHVDPGPAHAAPFEAPLSNFQVTQPFKGDAHRGVDLKAAIGTPGYAVADCTVVESEPAQGFGLWTICRANVDGGIVDFVYGHMNHLLAHVGDHFRPGDQIINTGNNGIVTGPHLHFEVWIGGRYKGHPVDPVGWLRAHGVNV